MGTKRLVAIVLSVLSLGAGCSLLPGGEEVSAACGRALARSQQVSDNRTRVLNRTAAVTEMDPARTEAVLAHRDEVQRAIFGPIAGIATRADRRVASYQRLRGRCRRDSTAVPPPCRRAFTQAGRLERTAAQTLETRMAFWSTQVRIAQRATSGDAEGTRQAVDRWGDLLDTYEQQLARFSRFQSRHQLAAANCRDQL